MQFPNKIWNFTSNSISKLHCFFWSGTSLLYNMVSKYTEIVLAVLSVCSNLQGCCQTYWHEIWWEQVCKEPFSLCICPSLNKVCPFLMGLQERGIRATFLKTVLFDSSNCNGFCEGNQGIFFGIFLPDLNSSGWI
jgi:hypothetical protein